ncbi:MAG: hypothetical protein ACFB16_03130 [Phormidesmis sp.]
MKTSLGDQQAVKDFIGKALAFIVVATQFIASGLDIYNFVKQNNVLNLQNVSPVEQVCIKEVPDQSIEQKVPHETCS